MNNESKIGVGVVALMVVCCAGPIVLSLVVSGAVLGALGAFWTAERELLLGSGALLIALGAWLLVRRRSRATPPPRHSPETD